MLYAVGVSAYMNLDNSTQLSQTPGTRTREKLVSERPKSPTHPTPIPYTKYLIHTTSHLLLLCLGPDELRDSLQLVGPRAVLSDETTAPRMAAAVSALRGREKLLAHVTVAETSPVSGTRGGAEDEAEDEGVAAAIGTEDLFLLGRRRRATAATYRPADIGDPRQHVAYILFSSGTTGKPKAVMTSDYSLLIHTLNPG